MPRWFLKHESFCKFAVQAQNGTLFMSRNENESFHVSALTLKDPGLSAGCAVGVVALISAGTASRP